MNSKTVFVAVNASLFASTVRETPKCWIADGDCWRIRDRRYSKDQPVPWRETPLAAAQFQVERRQATVERQRRELAEAEAELAQAEALVRSVQESPDTVVVYDRTTGAALDAKKSVTAFTHETA